MTLLDFEGDYGRTYNSRIRSLIPAYDAILEIGDAALAALGPPAASALVVGPGSGMELPGLLRALPAAQFTLVEPSAQMRGLCEELIAAIGAAERVHWGPPQLEATTPLAQGPFDAVISHNVLHVLPPPQQQLLLDRMVAQLAPGGLLVLSSYSEPNGEAIEPWLAVARARFQTLGMDADTIAEVMASRGCKVFSLDPGLLENRLIAAGLEPPRLLLQALCNRLWCSRRPALQCEGGDNGQISR
jgi:tRNA (cmo5U34)-methyltransferase